MKKMRKIITSILLIVIISYIFINFLSGQVYATQTISSDIDSIDSSIYPGYKEAIKSLQSEYPNWTFKVLYTDLDWATVIANEYTGHGSSPRNLIQITSTYNNNWVCTICNTNLYDNGTWVCASEQAVKYMMDPRNFINSTDIFQFEELTKSTYSEEALNNMVKGTYLEGHTAGIITAANNNNINPYYIVARLIQEQGKDGSVLVKGEGYQGQYVGYYNAFNIGATGNGEANVILAGLQTAQNKGWTSLDASIDGGIQVLAKEYISQGQNTLYLQKFDVDNSDGKLYWHQYMQNILAAKSEASTLRQTYDSVNAVSGSHTFIIPLYKNMPATACSNPNVQENVTSTDIVKINVDNSLRIRNLPNGDTTVGWVWKDEYVTRLEKATSKVGGTYWDKIMKSDGTTGYVARETYETETKYKLYLVPVTDTIENNTNTCKTGDCNGDGIINSGDLLTLQKHLLGTSIVTDENKLNAMDVNKDNAINSGDLLLIKKHLLGTYTIN